MRIRQRARAATLQLEAGDRPAHMHLPAESLWIYSTAVNGHSTALCSRRLRWRFDLAEAHESPVGAVMRSIRGGGGCFSRRQYPGASEPTKFRRKLSPSLSANIESVLVQALAFGLQLHCSCGRQLLDPAPIPQFSPAGLLGGVGSKRASDCLPHSSLSHPEHPLPLALRLLLSIHTHFTSCLSVGRDPLPSKRCLASAAASNLRTEQPPRTAACEICLHCRLSSAWPPPVCRSQLCLSTHNGMALGLRVSKSTSVEAC